MPKFGVSYFDNRFLAHAQTDFHRIASFNDYVVHTVSETDLLYHKAVLAKMFSLSRKAGLEVWADPWGLGGVFGGEALSKFLLDSPKSWQKFSDGRIVPSACLNRPEWRSFVKEWILNVRDMGAQVLFWDEPHVAFDFESELAGIYSCVCDVCQQLFKKEYGQPMPTRLTDESRAFRLDTMRSFLEEMMAYTKSKNMRNAICLYAFKGHEEFDRIWQKAAGLKDLDIFGCDPYWRWRMNKKPQDHVGEFAKRVVDHARNNNKQSQVWIQAMRLPAKTEEEIELAVKSAVDQGVDYIAAWSYDGGEILDTVLSEDPQKVREVLERAFQKFRPR